MEATGEVLNASEAESRHDGGDVGGDGNGNSCCEENK